DVGGMPAAVVRDDGSEPGAPAQNAGGFRRDRVNKPVRVLLLGAKGRMGQAIAAAAPGAGVEIIAGLDLGDDVTAKIAACDVVIDFSNPNATEALSLACREAGKPAVIGTTGHSE